LRVGDDDLTGDGQEAPAVRLRQFLDQQGELVLDLLGELLGQLSPLRRKGDTNGAPVLGGHRTPDEAPAFRPIDEPGDARLVEVEEGRHREHSGFAVAQDPQQSDLDQGEVMEVSDARDRTLNGEGELRQTIWERQVRLRHHHAHVCNTDSTRHQRLGRSPVGRRLDFVCGTN
jgi:hypothetical protein